MQNRQEREDAFRAFVQIPSVTASAGEEQAAAWLEARLDEAALPHERVVSAPGRPNVLASLPADKPSGLRPLVLISHMDVVPGNQAAWTHPIFGAEMVEGRIFARGTLDTKQLTLMELNAFLALARTSGRRRDVYLLTTIDEEAGSRFGMEAVKKAKPTLFENAVVWNEGGGFPLRCNGSDYMTLTVGEKAVCRVRLTAKGTGGHAAAPSEDLAIPKLAAAVRQVFSREDSLPSGRCQTAQVMRHVLGAEQTDNATANTLLRYAQYSTVDMRNYQIGQRINVLPAAAQTELQFRLLPDVTQDELAAWLDDTLNGTDVSYEITAFERGFESNFENSELKALLARLEELCAANGFACKVLPMLALGRTDGRFFGSEGSLVYGCSPLLIQDSFDVVLPKVHGNDESIHRDSFEFGCQVLQALTAEMAGGALAI